jgi:hypothetical protein
MEQITEDYVSFEVAKLLRDKGFDIQTTFYWLKKKGTKKYKKYTNEAYFNSEEPKDGFTFAPTQALVIKWLRIKHNIHISIQTFGEEKDYPKYLYQVCELKDYRCSIENALKELQMEYEDILLMSYNSPEKATEAAILYTLQNLIK